MSFTGLASRSHERGNESRPPRVAWPIGNLALDLVHCYLQDRPLTFVARRPQSPQFAVDVLGPEPHWPPPAMPRIVARAREAMLSVSLIAASAALSAAPVVAGPVVRAMRS